MGLFDIFRGFGKAVAKYDKRTLQFAAVCLEKGSLPEEYDFDKRFAARFFPGYMRKGIPTPKFGNNKSNNCVIAGRAHQTLRFELLERGHLVRITTKHVMDEYLSETGGGECNLEVLASLKRWRNVGWKVGARTSKIQLFTRLKPSDPERIKRAIRLNVGVGLGFMLPDSALAQFEAGEPWEVIREGGERSKPHNGHYVYASGYTKRGPICITWGRKQPMSWAFVSKYCDEAYAIIDALNTPAKRRHFDEKKIKKYLENCDEHEEG